jgi:hypothetical protein
VRKLLLLVLGLCALAAIGGLVVYYDRQGRELEVQRRQTAELQTRSRELETQTSQLRGELDKSNWERNWYRFFYQRYAAFERLRQYGRSDDTTALHARTAHRFIDIDRVLNRIFCPPPGNGLLGGDYLYFGARILALPHRDPKAAPDVVALSYLGNQPWAHGNRSFDVYLPSPLFTQPGNQIRELSASTMLLQDFLSRGKQATDLLAQPNGYFRPFGFNAADIDGDGRSDFILGKAVYLAKFFDPRSGSLVPDATPFDLPGESIFLNYQRRPHILSRDGDALKLIAFKDGRLEVLASFTPQQSFARRVPFLLLALPDFPDGAVFAVRAEDALQVYRLSDGPRLSHLTTITGLQPGEVLVGGFGRFVSATIDDFWLAQPMWRDPNGKAIGRIFLVPGERLSRLATDRIAIDELAAFRVDGSLKFTDYDGIGSSLSLIAGDIDGDGRPDFSFSGHRHMNEAGVLFILPGRSIVPGTVKSADDDDVIKIIGKPVSQLAPPYYHWDAGDLNGDGHSDVIVSADNDLCSGLNAGALYVLDGKAIMTAWSRR